QPEPLCGSIAKSVTSAKSKCREGLVCMIIDAHAHISGPDRVWEHFRELAGLAPGFKPSPLNLTNDEIRDSLTQQLDESAAVGTDMQFVVGRPWAVPNAFRREAAVTYITS